MRRGLRSRLGLRLLLRRVTGFRFAAAAASALLLAASAAFFLALCAASLFAFSMASFLARSAAASAALAAFRTASAARLAALKAWMASMVRLIALRTDGILPSFAHGMASRMMLPHDHMSPPKQAMASLMPMKSFSVSQATARITDVRDLPVVGLRLRDLRR